MIPLLAFLPAILAGLGGAAGVASGIASTVKESKQARNADLEKEKLQAEILKLNTTPIPLSTRKIRKWYTKWYHQRD